MATNGDAKPDAWATLAAEYRNFTVLPGQQCAKEMFPLLNKAWPLNKATAILDNGSGPGPVTDNLLQQYSSQLPGDVRLFASDASPGMLNEMRKYKQEKVEQDQTSLWKNVDITEADAAELTHIKDGELSHVVGGFVYFMLNDPRKALGEAKRVLADGGGLALSSWQRSDWADLMFLIKEFPYEGTLFEIPSAWESPEGVKGELEAAGFRNVISKPVDVSLEYSSQESLLVMLMEKIPFMARLTKILSAEDNKKLEQMMRDRMTEMNGPNGGTMHGIAIVAGGQK